MTHGDEIFYYNFFRAGMNFLNGKYFLKGRLYLN